MKAIRLPRLADLALEPGHLLAAGPAPRGPLVDHHRMAAQLREPLLKGVGAAGQELIGLVVELGERLGRARQRLRVVGRLAFVAAAGPAAARRQRQHDERKCRRRGQASQASNQAHPARENAVPPHSVQHDGLIRSRSTRHLDRGGNRRLARGVSTRSGPASLQRAYSAARRHPCEREALGELVSHGEIRRSRSERCQPDHSAINSSACASSRASRSCSTARRSTTSLPGPPAVAPSTPRWPSSTPASRRPRRSGGAATRCCSGSSGCSTPSRSLLRRRRAHRAPGRRALRHPRRADHRDRELGAADSAQRGRPLRDRARRRRRRRRPSPSSRTTGTAAGPQRSPRRTRPWRPTRRPQDWEEPADRDGRRGARGSRAQAAASGSSTRPAPARRSPRSGSSRPRAPAAS